MKNLIRVKIWKNRAATWVVAFTILSLPNFAIAGSGQHETGNSGVEDQLKFKLGDENGNEVKALKTEMLVMRSEKKALAELEKLRKKYQGTHLEPEILVRLAELHMRRARTERFFEVHKNSERIVTFVPELVKNASQAKEIRGAISIYETIQTKFPEFRSIDIVIFNNAYAHQQVGEHPAAEKLLLSLIKDQPDSPLVPDAYLAIGEISFNRREFTVALERFKALRKYPESRVYPYGIYKAAWAYYNLQDAESGLKELEDVVKFGYDISQSGVTSSKNAKLDLQKEALNDMALFFEATRPAKDAIDYFRAQARNLDATPFVLTLVEMYKRHSRYKDVDVILKDFVSKFTDPSALALAYEELIWNDEHMRERTAASEQLKAFDVWCDAKLKDQAEQADHHSSKQASAPAPLLCHDKLTDAAKKLAAKWHAQWKKQGGPDDLAIGAENAYRLYFKNAAAKDHELPNLRFAFAELLYARGKFREASDTYASIDKDQTSSASTLDAKTAHDAAYGAIVALEKSNNDKWTDQDEARFSELAGYYAKHFPTGTYALDLKFKRAFISYEKEHYDQAAPVFKDIGWNSKADPTPDEAEKIRKAQDLYLDILNVKKDYVGLKESTQALLKKESQGPRSTQLQKIYRESYFSEIQSLEEKGQVSAAVDAYKKFALENTASELAPKAWWNASQLQFKIGDNLGGAKTCHKMFEYFQTAPNMIDCLHKSAHIYEEMGRLEPAARVLLNLALVETAQANHWREVSADFFAMSGSKTRAVSMYRKLAEGQSSAEQSRLLDKALALAHEINDAHEVAELVDLERKLSLEPQMSLAVVEQAEAALADGDFTKAFNSVKSVVAKDGLPVYVQARARMVQAQVLEDEYKKQSIKAHVDRIGMVLAMKTEKLEKAQKAYQSVIHYGDASQSVKALLRLAHCYIDYSHTIREMQMPTGISEADVKSFKDEIEKLTVPMEEKGIETVSQALEAAKKGQLRGGEITEIRTELDRLNMTAATADDDVKLQSPKIYLPKFTLTSTSGDQQ